jgi:hypothetical protein
MAAGPMNRTMRTFTLTALSIGAGAGTAAAALVLAGGPSAVQTQPKHASSLKPVPTLAPAQNRQPLTAEARRELSAWGTRLVRCMSTSEIGLGSPRTGRSEIAIRIALTGSAADDPTVLMTRINHCDGALGKPPSGSSLTFDRGALETGRGTIRLFKPKTCPLPASPKKGPK